MNLEIVGDKISKLIDLDVRLDHACWILYMIGYECIGL